MKKAGFIFTMMLIGMMICGNTLTSFASGPGIVNLHIAISSKSIWNQETKNCEPREVGFCMHIWADAFPGQEQIVGEISCSDGKSLVLTLSKIKGIDRETYDRYFKSGKFMADGPITFSSEVLKKLGLPSAFSLPAGAYRCTVTGDEITVYLK